MVLYYNTTPPAPVSTLEILWDIEYARGERVNHCAGVVLCVSYTREGVKRNLRMVLCVGNAGR